MGNSLYIRGPLAGHHNSTALLQRTLKRTLTQRTADIEPL